MVEVKGQWGEWRGFGCFGGLEVDGVTTFVVMSRVIESGGGEKGVRRILKRKGFGLVVVGRW